MPLYFSAENSYGKTSKEYSRAHGKQTLLHFSEKNKVLSFKDMVNLMGLNRFRSPRIKKILRRMLHDGDIVLTRKGLYVPVSDVDLMTVIFEAHKEGYGFCHHRKTGRA